MTALLATLVVFMFHRVAPDVPANAISRALTVPVTAFEEELDGLQRRGIRTYTAAEAARALLDHKRVDGVVLTFDDGRSDGYDYILPALRKRGMHGTFYVNSGTIDGVFHMTWRQLRELRADGNEVGCHGAHHLDLSTLTRAEQTKEIGDCLDKVAAHAGARPATYAYASGKYDATTLALLRGFGILAAVTEHYGTVHDMHDALEWPRVRVDRDTPVSAFESAAEEARPR